MNENAKIKKIAHFNQTVGGGKAFKCSMNVYDTKGICPTFLANMWKNEGNVPLIIDLIKL